MISKFCPAASDGRAEEEAELPQATLPPAHAERAARGPGRAAKPAAFGKRKPQARPSRRSEGVTRLFIGGGRTIGLRPADLVGAIANEAGVEGRVIGAIDIADRFALVDVPEELADEMPRLSKELRRTLGRSF